MLQTGGFDKAPETICRRFIVDLNSKSPMSFIEYEWFSNRKVVTSMHDYNESGDYCGTSTVFDVIQDQQGNLLNCNPMMTIQYAEVMSCKFCAGRDSQCACSPKFRKRAKGFPTSVSCWSDWALAMQNIRTGASVVTTTYQLTIPNGSLFHASSVFTLENSCQRGLKAGVDTSQVGIMQRQYVVENGYLDFNIQRDQEILLSYTNRIFGGADENSDDDMNGITVGFTGPYLDGPPADESAINNVIGDGGDDIGRHNNGISLNVPKESSPDTSGVASIHNIGQVEQNGSGSSQSPSESPPLSSGGSVEKLSSKIRCPLCDHPFVHRGHYNEHMLSVHSHDRPYRCNVPNCNADFTRKADVHRHRWKVHKIKKRYECKYCEATFETSQQATAHKRLDHSDKCPYGCDKCENAYATLAGLHKHLSSNH